MSKAFAKSLSQLNKALVRRLKALVVVTRAQPPAPARPTTWSDALPSPSGGGGGVAVCKVEGGLLRSSSAFPYFMLVALEGGGLARALLLLLLYPALRLLGHDTAVRAMAVVTFLGLRKDAAAFRAGRAALPRLLLEDVSAEVFDAAVAPPRRRCVCVSAMPRAMVQPFLAEYLGVDAVVAPEVREFGGYYLGVMEDESEVLRRLDVDKVIAGDKKGGGCGVFGVAGLGSSFDQLFQNHCKVRIVLVRTSQAACFKAETVVSCSVLAQKLRGDYLLQSPSQESKYLFYSLGMINMHQIKLCRFDT